ncbi:MAG: excinuclease ABC subunit UvrA [Pseudomonadota bacterium]
MANRDDAIRVFGARQNNLNNLDLELPLGELIVITGVSGSGKSSLAFDTIYAEGQRRYVETFSPYARQFLDRMDKPDLDRIEGIPPAIAIDQTNPVRTSRSTVGTMTELNDHLKLLFARSARLYCDRCHNEVTEDHPEQIADTWYAEHADARIAIAWRAVIPKQFSGEEMQRFLNQQGYTRFHSQNRREIIVIEDRLRIRDDNRDRFVDSLESAMKRGEGFARIINLDTQHEHRYSSLLHCAQCDLTYSTATPSTFSFNSPIGACETCRGFGRTMGIDMQLVIPDDNKTLAEGAIRPVQTGKFAELQDRLVKRAPAAGVRTDVPFSALTEDELHWVMVGDKTRRGEKYWPGIKAVFDWLEKKAYKMHVRVMLSRYRSYETCATCDGARLKPDGLRWRLGDRELVARIAPEVDTKAPGLNIHELMLLPIRRVAAFFSALPKSDGHDSALTLLHDEINHRLRYLNDTGLDYLTLDRQSRTLSGGEVQRINLTTALGTSLVNTLFVLDEPSIGLHPRDIDRINTVLTRLRDAGNTLLVVEHDPGIMRAADRIIDIGPGPGERGGNIVFNGSLKQLARSRQSQTAPFLSGKQRVASARVRRRIVSDDAAAICIRGARQHNLKNVDVDIPLKALVVVTGVSGSGKSTLIGDIVYPALARGFGHNANIPGQHQSITGARLIDDIIYVDQTPIGKTTRSNPASFVGAWDSIRKLFTQQPLAVERDYKPGTFSFNSGTGRCPTCGGNGFEHIEMQFLSDVYLRCGECDGKRFRDEILEVQVFPANAEFGALSIADVLELTVSEALHAFADNAELQRVLQPMVDVGLEYLKLGQPVPTLSGGESQRLKLARHLGEARKTRKRGQGKLFLFDEPTTGLHFTDIEKLLQAFDQLLDDGHSVVLVEHNLDIIEAADWIIDLGPDGGERGGQCLYAGDRDGLLRLSDNATAQALSAYLKPPSSVAEQQRDYVRNKTSRRDARDIRIRNAREHNLRNVDVSIPHNSFTAITGVSGSGKSTLAFDILFNEGQRRYLESLNAYARQFVQPASRPDVDAVTAIPPTVAIEQRTSRGGRKSTVGTMTEIYHFLRLLFVKLGTAHCPECDEPIQPQSIDQISARLVKQRSGRTIQLLAPLVRARKGYYTDLAKWAENKGFDSLRVDGNMTPVSPWPRLDRYSEHDIELPVANVTIDASSEGGLRDALERTFEFGKGVIIVSEPGSRRKDVLFSIERACPSCHRSFPELDPRLFSYNSPQGWCDECQGTGTLAYEDQGDGDIVDSICESCNGQRLNPTALAVRLGRSNIAAWTELPVAELGDKIDALALSDRDALIARDVLSELRNRLTFLNDVGLGYLALSRAAPTLSGGEAQRIRLASQLGSNLVGVCYILDEPTIGLHARDNARLLATLQSLQRNGNTVVVVEHDEDTIRGAQHVIDVGPGAGVRGGEIVAAGSVRQLLKNRRSLTGRMLREPLQHPLREHRRPANPRSKQVTSLRIDSARRNNLRNVSVNLPLGRFVAVTGVSGSGKSSLIRGVVEDNVSRLIAARRNQKRKQPQASGCNALHNWESIQRVLEVDQTPIGKTPRSCPATYIGFWNAIRDLFAQTPEARIRGYTASRFSFNTKEGRCPECDGQGLRRIEMNFMPDVRVVCERCDGMRFTSETLTIRYRDKSIGDVLQMSVDDAIAFFESHPKILKALTLLQDVGLGYLTLGQPSPTLSGGEAQRIKLVSELAKARTLPDAEVAAIDNPHHTLYILDEPTIGLHMADVERLINVLQRLVDAGHSLFVIEHNLDVIAEADWVVDLGPEGGQAGGRIVGQGTPEKLVELGEKSLTGKALADFLDRNPQT